MLWASRIHFTQGSDDPEGGRKTSMAKLSQDGVTSTATPRVQNKRGASKPVSSGSNVSVPQNSAASVICPCDVCMYVCNDKRQSTHTKRSATAGRSSANPSPSTCYGALMEAPPETEKKHVRVFALPHLNRDSKLLWLVGGGSGHRHVKLERTILKKKCMHRMVMTGQFPCPWFSRRNGTKFKRTCHPSLSHQRTYDNTGQAVKQITKMRNNYKKTNECSLSSVSGVRYSTKRKTRNTLTQREGKVRVCRPNKPDMAESSSSLSDISSTHAFRGFPY